MNLEAVLIAGGGAMLFYLWVRLVLGLLDLGRGGR